MADSFLSQHKDSLIVILEETNLLRKFQKFPWISIQFYTHISLWL